MPFEQDVKELAYTLDPPCWASYSGKPRYFKAAMDDRRNASLRTAQDQIDSIKRRQRGTRVSQFVEEPHENFMVSITSRDGCKSVEYTDSLNVGDDIARWIAERPFKSLLITPN